MDAAPGPGPRILRRRIQVPREAIDANGHVNNQEYLRWMQEIAVEHSAALGWTLERYRSTGATWVVRSHFVEYLRPAFAGDVIEASTWVATMETRRSARRYRFALESGEVVARAETLWVFVDGRTGKPMEIPGALRADFPIVDGPDG